MWSEGTFADSADQLSRRRATQPRPPDPGVYPNVMKTSVAGFVRIQTLSRQSRPRLARRAVKSSMALPNPVVDEDGSFTIRFTGRAILKRRGNHNVSEIQRVYQTHMDALRPRDRVARSVAIFHGSRELIACQILAASGPMSMERLKWEVAMRMYGANSKARKMIQRQLDRVSN